MTTAWTKENVVVMHDDYSNTWIVKTIPLTYLQAVRFVMAKKWNHALNKGTVKIVTLDQFNNLQGA
jgi:hypothetical protein